MTLGGLALAIGILVDDATVTIENIHRHMGRKPLREAVLDGAAQIAAPTFVATLTICIVFVSVVFLTGPAKYLFTPMALAVVFAMIASYILSRTLVPVLAAYLLRGEQHEVNPETGVSEQAAHPAAPFPVSMRNSTTVTSMCERATPVAARISGKRAHRWRLLVAVVASAFILLPFIGRDFFPQVDAGQFRLHVRAPPACASKIPRSFSAV